jgi:hypothetical protein
MPAEPQFKASLEEIHDLKAALDEHAIVALTDLPGKITCVNDKFRAVSKYPREELSGQDHPSSIPVSIPNRPPGRWRRHNLPPKL